MIIARMPLRMFFLAVARITQKKYPTVIAAKKLLPDFQIK